MSSRPSTFLRRATTRLALLGAAIGALTAQPAAAQTTGMDGAPPACRAATLVVGGGAGSGTDLIARALAGAANRSGMKPPLKVRNIDGDDGVDGARAVLEAPGDGCMMLAAHQGLLANFLTWRADFAWHDFRHVALLTRTPLVLVAPVASPYSDAEGMIAAARSGTVKVGVGPGTTSEFALRALAKAAKVEFDYDVIEGGRERVLALMSAEIGMAPVPSALAKRLSTTHVVRSLAVTDRAPSSILSDIATLRDQGIPFDYAVDLGILLPASATAELAATLAAGFEKALEDQELQRTLQGYDVRIEFRPLTQYTIYWENLMASWREIAVEAGYDRTNR